MADRENAIYRALADPHRRTILSALCREPQVAGDLARLVGLAPNAVSFHLKVLQSADLVIVRREGRFLRYHAHAEVLDGWRERVGERFVARARPESVREPPLSESVTSRGEGQPPVVDEPVPWPGKTDDRLPTELL